MLWIHTAWNSLRGALRFKYAGLGQTAPLRSGSPHYPLLMWTPPPKRFSSLSCYPPPLSSGISPLGTACVSLDVFASLPRKTLFVFSLTIFSIRICDAFSQNYKSIYGQVSPHQTRTITQSVIILSCSSEAQSYISAQ